MARKHLSAEKTNAGKKSGNCCNGKTLRISFGDADVSVHRDRKREFEPQVLREV